VESLRLALLAAPERYGELRPGYLRLIIGSTTGQGSLPEVRPINHPRDPELLRLQLADKAATIGIEIMRRRPLPHSNAFAAYHTMRFFVTRNGGTFTNADDPYHKRAAHTCQQFFDGELTDKQFRDWVNQRIATAD
jgi:prophage maintenance system killer protein